MSEQLAKRYTQVIQYFDGGKKVAEFAQSPDETEARLVWIDEEIGKPLPRERREPRAGGAMSEQERKHSRHFEWKYQECHRCGRRGNSVHMRSLKHPGAWLMEMLCQTCWRKS